MLKSQNSTYLGFLATLAILMFACLVQNAHASADDPSPADQGDDNQQAADEQFSWWQSLYKECWGECWGRGPAGRTSTIPTGGCGLGAMYGSGYLLAGMGCSTPVALGTAFSAAAACAFCANYSCNRCYELRNLRNEVAQRTNPEARRARRAARHARQQVTQTMERYEMTRKENERIKSRLANLEAGFSDANSSADLEELREKHDKLQNDIRQLRPNTDRSEPPDEYFCPITGCLMTDPVMLVGDKSKTVYERAAIERYMKNAVRECTACDWSGSNTDYARVVADKCPKCDGTTQIMTPASKQPVTGAIEDQPELKHEIEECISAHPDYGSGPEAPADI